MFRTLLCTSLLAATLTAGDPPQDPARLLPPNTIFYVGTPSLQAGAEAAKASAMRKILDEPEVKAFFSKPVAAADKVLQGLVAASGLPSEATPRISLADMMSGTGTGMPIERFFVALTHLGMPAPGAAVPDVGFVLGLEMRDAKDLGLVKALWSMIPVPEESVAHGARSYVVKRTPDGPPIALAFIDRLAVMSLSTKTLETVMDNTTATGASLADTAEYKQMVGLSGQKLQADSSTWMLRTGLMADMLRDIMGMVRMAMAGQSPGSEELAHMDAVAKIIDGVGLRSINWMGGESHRDAQGRVIGTLGVAAAKDKSGFIGKCLGVEMPLDLGLLKTVPDKCLSMSMFSVDWVPHLYDFLVDSFRAAAPNEAAEVLAMIQTFMGEASLRDDLLANAHGSVLMYGMPGDGFPGRPTTIVRVPLRNPDGFIKALRAIVSGVANAFQPFKALRFNESKHEGLPFYEIDMSATPGAYVMMQPAMAIDGGALIMCPESATTLKTALNGVQGGTLADNKDLMGFANGMAAKGVVTGLSYSDNARTFGAAYGQVAPMFSMMGGMLGDIPVDLSLMPTEQAISRHLGFSWGGGYDAGNGLFVERSVSEFALGDFMPILLTAGVIGLDMARGHHGDMEPMEVEVAPDERVQQDLQQLSAAMTIYKITQRDYPAALGDLVKPLPDYPEGCLGKPDLPMDPWGSGYLFRLNEKKKPVLWSAGPNKMDEGGQGDDIVKK